PAGMHIGEAQQLFPRIELAEEDKAQAQASKKEKQPKQEKAEKKQEAAGDGLITIDDFGKVKLQVVEIVEAEPVPKADKLLKLIVDTGTEKRKVVSGIAKHYEIGDLIGKRVILVMNLKPAKLRGVESQGMILAATKGDELEVVTVDMPVGSIVR
ncbi:methionine--tRNA ligase subunit beta, partial [Anaerovibrio lipolyticus]